MALRHLLAGLLFAALLDGCASAPPRWPTTRAAAPDPQRWERAACRRDEYPPELDGNAFARARWEDLRARQEGAPAPDAAARLERERAAFEARCATWRAERELARL